MEGRARWASLTALVPAHRFSGLAAGIAIGIAGDAGVRAVAQQTKMYVGMVLILIFAEALGLYGLIIGLIMTAKGDNTDCGM